MSERESRRLAVSNLAWPGERLMEALDLLVAGGMTGVEVAPTRIAPWQELNTARLQRYRQELSDAGLVVSSLQAIFYGRSDAQLLGDAAAFAAMAEHLRRVADIAGILGTQVAVFGAPRNRNRGDRPTYEATALAAERLWELGELLIPSGLILGMEPVPENYQSDFLLTAEAVRSLVAEIAHPQVRLHLDTACVSAGGTDLADAVQEGAPWLVHFQAAQPALGGFDSPLPDHVRAATALRQIGYSGWVAIEMLEQPNWQAGLEQATGFVYRTYGE